MGSGVTQLLNMFMPGVGMGLMSFVYASRVVFMMRRSDGEDSDVII